MKRVMILSGLFIISFAMFLTWQSAGLFVSDSKAIKQLEVEGYTKIQIVDRAWFLVSFRGGGYGDVARFEAKAVNPVGKEVSVFVYSGWPFKGATVRSE